MRLGQEKMGAVVVDLLFFCAAGIERLGPDRESARRTLYNGEWENKILLRLGLDLYAGRCVNEGRKAIKLTAKHPNYENLHYYYLHHRNL